MTAPIVVLGAGMAGFGAAHRLHCEGARSVLYEKLPHAGGHTASHTESGFTFDEGPHISFTGDERIRKLFAASVGDKFVTTGPTVNNYWRGHWIRHPAQTNLHGLPVELIVDIIEDFVAASSAEHAIANYKDWLYASFGRTFAETFPMRYTEKYHTTAAENLTTDWVAPRIYRPKLEELLRGALQPDVANVHYVTEFRYPQQGGFVSFLRAFLEQTDLQLAHEVVAIDPREKLLRFANGQQVRYGQLISSIPLPELVRLLRGAPDRVLAAAGRLACSQLVLVTLGIDRDDLTDAHWTYFYDQDIEMSRLSTPHMQSRWNAPPGCGSFQAEVYFSAKYKPLTDSLDVIAQRVCADLRRVGLLRETDRILFQSTKLIPYANVIFDHDRSAALAEVHGYLDEIGIAYCGRYGDWAYIWTDQSFMSGENAAQKVLDRAGGSRAPAE